MERLREQRQRVRNEVAILDEATDNLREAVQRIRATRNRLRASVLNDDHDYGELAYRISAALAMTEAAFVEARRRSERGDTRKG